MDKASAQGFGHPPGHDGLHGGQVAQVFLREHGKHGVKALLNLARTKPRNGPDDGARSLVRCRQHPCGSVSQLIWKGPCQVTVTLLRPSSVVTASATWSL